MAFREKIRIDCRHLGPAARQAALGALRNLGVNPSDVPIRIEIQVEGGWVAVPVFLRGPRGRLICWADTPLQGHHRVEIGDKHRTDVVVLRAVADKPMKRRLRAS